MVFMIIMFSSFSINTIIIDTHILYIYIYDDEYKYYHLHLKSPLYTSKARVILI